MAKIYVSSAPRSPRTSYDNGRIYAEGISRAGSDRAPSLLA